ncbi:protein of unknown function [Candidatus Hydrogenisulfobacillus filiaventi]|uniref:Uncharacterized protein n=1 Tax=Candidatus Hydrogenisulfobacillus filiaventi TaxID=2707344 RepID=A0A6F8ZHI9_9FIRM|nr:protein of unknown function [Candidatus Hydrogenisulfobacillus filiaventi]
MRAGRAKWRCRRCQEPLEWGMHFRDRLVPVARERGEVPCGEKPINRASCLWAPRLMRCRLSRP